MTAALAVEAIEDAFQYGPSIFAMIENLYAAFKGTVSASQKVVIATDILATSSAAVATSLATQPASATHLDSVLNSIHAATDTASLEAAKAIAMEQAQAAQQAAGASS